MQGAVEHIVFAVVKKDDLTEALCREINELSVAVVRETGGVLGHTVTYTEMFIADVVAIVQHWFFESEAARNRFRDGKIYAAHLEKMRPIMIDKHIFGYEHPKEGA